jgi:lipopolysaccharide export system protein LptC
MRPKEKSNRGVGALVPLTILLLLVGLTAWLNRTVEQTLPAAARPITHDPDYVVEKFTVLRLSELGETHYSLSAQKLIHYPDDDTSHLAQPVLRELQSGKPDVRIRADRGLVTAQGDEAKLYDNVEIFRAGDKKAGKAAQPGGTVNAKPGAKPASPANSSASEDLRITTSYLRVLPDADHADTPAQVTVENGLSTLIGTGMDFDNRYRNVRLHSAVTARYIKRPE